MKETFATRLMAARKLRDMTQGDLGKRAGIDMSAISHFESGTRAPSLANLEKIVVALDVSADYLLGAVDTMASGASGLALCRRIDKLSDRDRAVVADLVRAMERRK